MSTLQCLGHDLIFVSTEPAAGHPSVRLTLALDFTSESGLPMLGLDKPGVPEDQRQGAPEFSRHCRASASYFHYLFPNRKRRIKRPLPQLWLSAPLVGTAENHSPKRKEPQCP
jgi:hypothetical protein